MFRNLTEYEIDALPQSCILTDGHASRRWFAAEEAIIDRPAQLLKNNNRQRQNKTEREYVRDCSRLAKQPRGEGALNYLMRFTAPVPLVGEGLQSPR